MQVPPNLSIRDVSDMIGPAYPVSVIDVQHQEELEGWTLGDLVEYFEDEDRLMMIRQRQYSTTKRRRRSTNTPINQPKVLNQISLEFRHTPLATVVKSPQFVRDLDWIDQAWPDETTKPQTQYYCLTSTAGCYTDFHVDFGGTSVWYHVMTGQKHFLLIPPTEENLKIYEDWLCRPDQSVLFLPDIFQDPSQVQKVVLQQGQTLFIPCGWIHSVYTPSDSLVLGGNFLHGLDIAKQIDVHSLEMRTKVPAKFRFPKYLGLAMHAAVWYLEKLRKGDVCKLEYEQLPILLDALVQWSRVGSDPEMVKAMKEIGSAEEVLMSLQDELERIKKNGGQIVPNPKHAAASTSNLATAERPKIRLKLSDSSSTEPTFKIKLSTGSQYSSLPPTKNRRQGREDWDSFSPTGKDGDDEWKPSATLTLPTSPRTSVSTRKRPASTTPTSSGSTTKKRMSSSRERLMKRLK
jgi:F-box/leucine-rich repeat protein 10/11